MHVTSINFRKVAAFFAEHENLISELLCLIYIVCAIFQLNLIVDSYFLTVRRECPSFDCRMARWSGWREREKLKSTKKQSIPWFVVERTEEDIPLDTNMFFFDQNNLIS
jgi:hypothetical protein